ncbi:unnamed protein product [Rotaria sp. Silwood1]|nr:unnamed protein product [Rotaria sp. Silwood1]CAF1317847.1 unnamed protein product [Rotaria sp. Silwood1]CAF1320911.1 unnamed protein product [Rotaria sp. Silwood1]CAF3509469.1 unnamed protein product [Rotaria sp. Silwood1]CAF3520623.1 unnamed protein product [Rotaria sp. Silwood1]
MSTDVMNIPTGTASSDDLSDQRGNNDNELRDLVYQALERDGLIFRLKAQLRAAVFKTIEKATNPTATNSHSSLDDGMTGRICRALILDWLEHSRLLYTEDVFKVETSGPNHPIPLTHNELLEQLHLNSNQIKTQPILHVLLDHNTNQPASVINSLPDYIKQSIDNQFPNEKINDLNRIRDHFRALFSSAFDSSILDTFINKNISSSTSLSKHDYEQICLKWMQGCANALKPPSTPMYHISSIVSTNPLTSRNTTNNDQVSTPARRAASPSTDSSSSSSTSSSENPRKTAFDFPLPTTMNSQKSIIKKTSDIVPPSLINFDESNSSDEQEEDGSASIFSNRNATPTALEHLKTIDNILLGNETPRTRTIPKKPSNNGTKDAPAEYEDESMSHSVSHSIISSVDDITVDKASPSPSANIDYLEDYEGN